MGLSATPLPHDPDLEAELATEVRDLVLKLQALVFAEDLVPVLLLELRQAGRGVQGRARVR